MDSPRSLWRDYLIVRALRKRGWKRSEDWVLARKSDGHLFAPGHPQNFGQAMLGLFTGKNLFHFYRVREWHGIMIASRKVFWLPQSASDFSFKFKCSRFDLPPWPEATETLKIAELRRAA
jgi:hypothetical protein